MLGWFSAPAALRLLLEAPQALGVGENAAGKDLDRHVAAEPRVPRPIHLAHASGADRREDLVGTELRSDRQRHYFTPSTRNSVESWR